MQKKKKKLFHFNLTLSVNTKTIMKKVSAQTTQIMMNNTDATCKNENKNLLTTINIK